MTGTDRYRFDLPPAVPVCFVLNQVGGQAPGTLSLYMQSEHWIGAILLRSWTWSFCFLVLVKRRIWAWAWLHVPAQVNWTFALLISSPCLRVDCSVFLPAEGVTLTGGEGGGIVWKGSVHRSGGFVPRLSEG